MNSESPSTWPCRGVVGTPTHILHPPLPLQYYSYYTPAAGILTVKACGTAGFAATVTVMAEASVEGGKPTPLACGTCTKPAR